MGTMVRFQYLCEDCGRQSDADAVERLGGKCPFCGRDLTGAGSAQQSQCLCEHCGKYSDPADVAAAGGRCPACGKEIGDRGVAEPVYMVGGRSRIGYDKLAVLNKKQQATDRRVAKAQGNDEGKAPSLTGDDGTQAPPRRIFGGDDDIPREKPDFAPDPIDSKLQEEIAEAEAAKMARDAWEVDDDDLDEFGNPIVRDADGNAAVPAVQEDPDVGGTEEDPFGADAPPDFELLDGGGFEDEIPGGDGPDMDDGDYGDAGGVPVPDSDSGVEPYDHAAAGVSQGDAWPGEDHPWSYRDGVPTRRELSLLTNVYPASVAKGFDRGPRANFKGGPVGSQSGTVDVDGLKFPAHKGTIRCLDGVPIAYRNDFDVARQAAFVDGRDGAVDAILSVKLPGAGGTGGR